MLTLQITQVLCRLRSLLIHAGLAYCDYVWLVGSSYHLCRGLHRATTRLADCIWKQLEAARYFCLGGWSKYVRELHLEVLHGRSQLSLWSFLAPISVFEYNFYMFSLQAWMPWIPAKPLGLAPILVHIIFIMFVLNWLFVLFLDCFFFPPSSSLLHILDRQHELERAWLIPKLSKIMSLNASLIKASCFTLL